MAKTLQNDNLSNFKVRLRNSWPYLAIFVFALAVRFIYLAEIKGQPVFTMLLGDAESYDAWAQEIVRRGWIGERTFYQAPFYPYFLALIYTIGAHDFVVVRLAQAAIGAASCVLLAAAGVRFFDRRTGWIAGVLLSLYAPAVFFDLLIQKAVLGMFFMCLLIFLMSKIVDRDSDRSHPAIWILMGVVLACFALVRENALILVPAVGTWMIVYFRSNGWQLIVRKGLLLAVGLACVFSPVILRNYVVGGEFVLTTSQLGPNFYIGNNQDATGFYRPLIWDRSDWKFERTDAQSLAEKAAGRELTPNEVSDYWLSETLTDIKNDPGRWLLLMGKKWLMTWNAVEISDSESIYAHYRFSALLGSLGRIFQFGVLMPLAILGVCLSWPQRKNLWGLLWVWLCFAASVTLFFVFARYRHPMAAMMLLFAAAGLTRGYQCIHHKQIKTLAVGVVFALLGAVFVNWPVVSIAKMEAPTHFNIGYELEQRNDLAAANSSYLKSVEMDWSNTLAHNNLGMVAMKRHHPDEAIRHFEDAVAAKPDNWDARVNLGIVLGEMGRKAEAIEQYKQVVSNEPDYNPSLYYNIACYYAVAGQTDEGMAWLRKALDHGYSNWDLMRQDPDLDNLRTLPGFPELQRGN